MSEYKPNTQAYIDVINTKVIHADEKSVIKKSFGGTKMQSGKESESSKELLISRVKENTPEPKPEENSEDKSEDK